jgi:glycosyltransferase involved in cell wall biosynthesis
MVAPRSSARVHRSTSFPRGLHEQPLKLRPLRIVHVITDLKIGGESRQLAASITALPEFEHAVACLAANLDPAKAPRDLARDLRATGAPVLDLGSRRGSPLRLVLAAARLADFITEVRPDLIHSTLVHANIMALAVAPHQTPVIATLVSVKPWTANWQPRVHRMLSRRADVVLVNSPAVAAAVVASGGAEPERIRCLPYGVDVERFTPKGDVGDLGDGTVIVGIGRLVEHKGFADLIAAAAAMNPRPRVALLGEGPLAEDLRAVAIRLGVDLRLLGAIDDVAPYLRRADAVAFPSRWEGFPNALLEALATARPIVATMAGGIPGVVRDREHAFLARPGDPQAFASALERALGEEGREIARRGRELVVEQHGWRRYIDSRRLLYTSLARPPRVARP